MRLNTFLLGLMTDNPVIFDHYDLHKDIGEGIGNRSKLEIILHNESLFDIHDRITNKSHSFSLINQS